jgi:hypothetical protein
MQRMRAVELLLEACEPTLGLLRSPVLAERWAEPSALTEWSNGGLAGHLARAAFNLERALDQRGSDEGLVDAIVYYANSDPEPPDSPIGRRIRELGDQEAAAGHAVLADRFAASVARLRDQAVPLSPTVAVQMFGRLLSIDDCASACLLELVVHTDDLAVSLGLPTPVFSAPVMDLVMRTLYGIARAKHGDLAVLRALSRSERAPVGGVSAF